MPHQRQLIGQIGETAAVDYLTQAGYSIVARNWHAGRYGEIDIIARYGDQLVLVEVKTRSSIYFGFPEEAVNKRKQFKLQGAAQAFILSHPHLPQEVRFDVIAIVLSPDHKIADFKHFKGIN